MKTSKTTLNQITAKGFSTVEFVITITIIAVMMWAAIPAITNINKTVAAKPVSVEVSKAYNRLLDAGKVPPEVMNGTPDDIVKFVAGKGEGKVDIGDHSPETVAFLLEFKPGPYLIINETKPASQTPTPTSATAPAAAPAPTPEKQ